MASFPWALHRPKRTANNEHKNYNDATRPSYSYVDDAPMVSIRRRNRPRFRYDTAKTSFTRSARYLPSYIINAKLLFKCRIWKYVSELHDIHVQMNGLQLFIIIRLAMMMFVFGDFSAFSSTCSYVKSFWFFWIKMSPQWKCLHLRCNFDQFFHCQSAEQSFEVLKITRFSITNNFLANPF